jgi:hypothetical protein
VSTRSSSGKYDGWEQLCASSNGLAAAGQLTALLRDSAKPDPFSCLNSSQTGDKRLDPPYNIKIDGHAVGKGKVRHREFAMASGEMSESEFTRYLQESLGACAVVSRDGAVHFVCMDHHHVDELTQACRSVYGPRLGM